MTEEPALPVGGQRDPLTGGAHHRDSVLDSTEGRLLCVPGGDALPVTGRHQEDVDVGGSRLAHQAREEVVLADDRRKPAVRRVDGRDDAGTGSCPSPGVGFGLLVVPHDRAARVEQDGVVLVHRPALASLPAGSCTIIETCR